MSNRINSIPRAMNNSGSKQKELPRYTLDEIIKQMKNEPLRFSFTCLDLEHDLFNCGETHRVKDSWFTHLLNNLSEISKLNFKEFVNQRQHYDLHPIDWDQTSCKPTLADYHQYEFMQFRLSSSTGRVHGYFVDNTFFILWLDPHHNLLPDQRFGGPKYYSSPKTPYTILEEAHSKLQEEYNELFALIDDRTA